MTTFIFPARHNSGSFKMFVWCTLLFVLGLLAFIDSIFNMGNIFRQVNSVLFMLVSIGLLVRTSTKIRTQKTENYEQRIFDLEQQLYSSEKEQETYQDN